MDYVELAAFDPKIQIVEDDKSALLRMTLDEALPTASTTVVTTERLGKAKVSGQAYENADGSPVVIDYDFFGKSRGRRHPTPGPFEGLGTGPVEIKVW
jgi:alpha-N-arabinofuranosidase